MFKKVCIIGCGLIGSSIARGIKKNKLATKIVSSNRSNNTNKKVIKLKIVNEASSDTKKIVKGSDLIIIASPLSSYKNIILKIRNSLKNGAILTDVGSVKKNAISLIEKISKKKCNYKILKQNRIGDHLWWISDNSKFIKDYPEWKINVTLKQSLKQMVHFELNNKK